MSYHFRSWLDGLKVRLSGKRGRSTGTLLRREDTRRRRRVRLSFEALEARVTPVGGLTPFAPTSYVIDMSQMIPGTTSLNLETRNAGASGTTIEAGDLLLIRQVSNSSSGSEVAATSAPFEYVVALSAVSPTGGVLKLQGVGPGGGLLNSYSSGQGRDAFEVIDLDARSATTVSRPCAMPAVLTRKLEYSPGQVAIIDAAGFKAGETIQFQVANLANGHVYNAWTATAGTGPLQTAWFVPLDAAQSQLVLTATGESSAATARYTFRDAAMENLDINVNFADINSTATFTVYIQNTSTDGSVMKSATITVPTGYTAISVGSVTSSSGTWTFSLAGQVIKLTTTGAGLRQPGSGNDPHGDWLRVDVQATTPGAPTGTPQWSVTTYTDTNFTSIAVNPTTIGVNVEPVTTLTAPITTTTQTSITVADTTGLSNNQLLVIGREIVKILSISGNTLTVQRAQSSTTAGTWAEGTTVRATGDSNQAPAGRQYATAYISPGLTTLNGAITATTTTITVASGAGISNGDILELNSEWVQVVAGGGTTTLTVRRGIDNTLPAAQANGTSISKVFALSPNVTTLNGAITAAQTTITVASGATITNSDFLVIDGEYMQVTAGGGTTSLTVTRGLLGTTAASHANSAQVSETTAPTVAPGTSQNYTMTLTNTDVGANNETLFNQTITLPTSFTSVSLPVLTTLAAPITSATQTSITITSAAGIATGETIVIDGEYMTVNSITGNTLTVSRGQSYNDGANSTIATTHPSGAQVEQGSFTAFTSAGAVRGMWTESIDGNFIHLYENHNQPLQPGDYVDYQFSATAAGSGPVSTTSAAWHTLVTRDTTQVFPLDGGQPFVVVQQPMATPTLTTTPSPSTVTLGSAAPPILTDLATLSGGRSPTGTITFTLFYNGGATPVDTETVNVNGNGTYTTPTGFTLPSTGTVTGAYQWNASYSGDPDDNPVTDNNDPTEQVTVGAASPAISTSQQPATATVGTSIADKATLTGAFRPTGTVTFNLFNNPNGTGTPLFTDTEPLSGGMATSKSFTPTATGTDYWVATYNGDGNNNPVTSSPGSEPVVITPATPAISTTTNPTTITLGATAPPILKDTATLSAAFQPTGTLTFTLFYNGGATPVDTETVTVNGNGTYTTPTGFTLATTGIVTGTYQWNTSFSGDSNNNAVTNNNDPTERVTVSAATPALSTTPNPMTITLGATAPPTLKDMATLSGGFRPTGTITFTLFYNGGTTPVDTETVTVNGNRTFTTPTGFTLPITGTVTGTYQWNTSYSGDTNNNTISDNNDPTERVTVNSASPTISTSQQPATATVGTSIADKATVTGGFNATGTVSFSLFNNPNGTGTPLFTDTELLSGGMATSKAFTTTATGTDFWVATYNGDGNNNAVTSGTASEPVVITQAAPTISTTQQPAMATVGSAIADRAMVAGGFNPTGTVTFNLFNNPNGTGAPLFTDTEPLSGGMALSKSFTATTTGTDFWMAAYNGDSNNTAVTSGTALEPVVIAQATPAISTTPQPAAAAVGSTIADQATVTGGFNASGTVTFNLFNNPNGIGTPLFTDTEPLSGGMATSRGFTATAAGTDYWVATYNGDSNNNAVTSGTALEPVIISAGTVVINTTPNPTTVTLTTGSVTLKDSATLAGGTSPTGTITFTLFYNGGATPVDTETVPVNGNGVYTTPTGLTLATTGTVTGTYQWNASYSGDSNNSAASDNNAANERVTVNSASPAITTSPNPTSVTLGLGTETLTDTATLAGGFHPTGTVTFTLFYNGGATPVDTETVSVNGNGTYVTPTGFTLPRTGTVTGTYQWDATYTGDTNNNTASDTNALNELVTVSAARPTLTTTPSPMVVTLGAGPSPILTDTADLERGFRPIGTITFTLFHSGSPTPVDTETVAADGNGTYTTPTGFTLPTAGTVTGTYQWVASYSDRFGNNDPVTDADDPNERVTVVAATPTISTTANPSTAGLGTRLQDAADLSGYHPTGSITFTLFAPGVDPSVGPATYSETVTGVNGSGTYQTSVGFVANVTGTWHWVANYNGDPNNKLVTSGPLDEPVTVPQQADLALAKTVSDPTPNVGDTITFTVTLTDKGPDTATNVTVTDLLPAGLNFVSANPGAGTTYDSVNGLWTVGTVTTTAAQTLTLTARVDSPEARTNTATISHSDQFDPDSSNNQASATETPQQADLALQKSVNDPHPNVGDTITFTVTLTNNGPDTATNAQVTDLLPAGLALVSATPSQGTYVNTTGLWTVGTVANAAVATLQIQATVNSPNAQLNKATISHADQFDPDTGNNTASALESPQQADLAVGKSVSNPTPNVGDTITYTVHVTNNGPDAATGVTLQDVLPAGVSFQSSSATAGTFDPGTRTWTVGTVANATTETLTITATVVSPNPQSNTASISHSDQFDPNPANNNDMASINPQHADLQLGKTVSNPTPNVGDTITFTVSLTDNGPNTATNVTVQDLLPAGLMLVSATPSQGTYVAGTGVWTVGTVTTTTPQTLTFQAKVISSSAQTNTATNSHSDQFDPDPGNNSASATETPQQADLALVKSVSDPTPNVGDTVTFTVTLTDLGPDAASGVTVQDLLPAGLSLVSFSPSRGTYTPATGVWNVGTIDPSVAQTLTLTAKVVSPSAQTNTATISHSDQFDPVTTNNSASATETPQQSDLAVTKTVSNTTPNVGDTITFTVTLTNKGPDAATGVTVADSLPPGLTLVSATPSQGTFTGGVWTVGEVDTTAPATLTLTATVISPNAQTNTATISHGDQFDPNPANNSASATETPQQADLAVMKSVSNPTPNVGDTITFTVTLTDRGPDTATNVSVQDLLPAGLTFVSATPSQGSYSNTTGAWTVGTVTTTMPQTLTIHATVASPNALTNTATISHSDQFDPNTANNSASANETPQQADLAVMKSFSNQTPNVDDTITFTVTLTDNGPDTATNVMVQDLLPAGLTFVDATPSQGTYSNTTGAWNVGTVTTTVAQTLTIQATVVSPNAQTNTASISHSDQFDPNTGNNQASATETPQQADLQVMKAVSNPTPNVGDNITYTITLTDNGPDTATNVSVHDTLPAGVSFVSANPSQGNYNSGTGIWTVGTVTVGTPLTLIITAHVVSPNPAANTASVSHSDQFDPNTTNNSDTADINPQQADLALGKIVSNPRPNVGDTITFTVNLTDNGPADATGVQVTDLLPAGLTLVSANPSQGTYISGTGLWDVGSLAKGAHATLTFQATVVSSLAQTNTATISHADQFDPNTGNNSASATETPQQADLAVTKTVSNPTPNVGDTVTFTVTLADLGPDPATNVTVEDLLPAGLTFVSATPSQGGYSSATGVWTVGTVTTTTAQTLLIQATVTSPNPQTNTASVSHSDQFDPNTANNSASATETPQQADLAVMKTVSNATPNVDDVITYTVTLTNHGPDAATGVSISEPIPTGLGFVSATTSAGTYDSGTGVWTVGTLHDGASAVLTVEVRVNSATAQTNTASVSHSDQFDPNTANNTASTTETPQQADLALAKSVSNPTPNVGDTITFTVTLTDKGPDTATNVTVADLLPAGLTFIAATPSQGNYTSATGTWIVGSVTTATPQTLQIQARVDSPSARTNTATIRAADQFDPDTTNNSASATETPQQADLAVSKTGSNATPNVGDVITYTVTLTNNGPGAATSVAVSDPLPPGLSFVSFTASAGSYDSGTGLWTVGNIAANTAQTLQIQATVVSPGAQTNTAAVSHSDQFDPNTSNNQASTTETPQQADLAVSKTVSNAKPNVGDTITFTVTLTNNGPDAATNVTVTDLLPVGLTFVSANPSQGMYSSTTGLWSVGTVTAATPETLTIQAQVVSPGTQTNTATISHSDQFDPNPGNNSAGATETPQQADLAVIKTVSNSTPNVGDTITYTITLSDNGPDPATDVTLHDALPAGIAFVSAATTAGSYDSNTGIWTVGTVVVGAPQTLTITATVQSPNSATNTATISHSDQFDPNPANNSSTAPTNPQEADLALAKTVSNSTPNVGDTITFTVTLTNSGPSAATGVQVSDLLPAGLTLVAATPVQGTYTSATGLWNVGAVPAGGQAVLILQATVVSPGAQTNTATISHADQFDPNPGNNSASATETPQQADLAVTKTVSNATPNVGDTITFTVTLRDLGPNPATNVTVNDLLPAGLSLLSATSSQGTYSSGTGVWTVGAVDLSTARTLTLTAKVVSSTAQTNTASVGHSDQFDPNTANNSASATETPQQADLALAKSVSDATPNVGDTITFTITLTNTGPDAATNVAVNDLLPAGLSFVSAMPSLGSYNDGTGLWTVGTLASGTNATLTIEALVASPAAQTNTATIGHSDQFDPNTTNNSATATETPQEADLALAKSVSNATPNVGDTITFTVTLTNLGPDPATGVKVTDPLPAGLNLLAATPSEGTYDPIMGVWTVGTVNPGTPQTLSLQVRVQSSSAQTNTAAISHSDQFDPVTTNNSASAIETPQRADLRLTKTVNNATPNVGDTVTFTVTLADLGPNAATNVTVQDLLPAGLTFVAATPSQGTYSSTTGAWNVGTLTTTTAQTLQIEAKVISPNAQTNTASVSHSDQFDPNTGNNQASATETPQQADLQVSKSVSNPTPNVGDNITYTVTLTNNGPDTATNVTLQDTLPAGVTFVSATPSQGNYNSGTGVWTVGTVVVGTPRTLIITAHVVSPNPAANTASVSHSDQFDPNPANNSATASTNPQESDLAIGKTVSNARPNVGDTITFTVTLTNSGPGAATHVTVSDLLPTGLQFVSATPSVGFYDHVSGAWTVGTLTTTTAQTLQIEAKVISPNAQTNTASVSHSDQFDPNPGNNTGTVTETPQQADLAVNKTVSNSTPNVGDTITFTVTLADLGPDAATNVTVQDLLPVGLTLLSSNASRGTYNAGVWTVGSIDPSAAQTLTLTARVDSSNSQTNTATVSHSDQFDPNTANNSASATETPQQADLVVTKSVSDPTPNVGDTITFTVALSNTGPDAATNVSVTDLLPPGLGFVATTPSLGNYNSITGLWTVGTMGSSAMATLQIQARVVSSSAQTNTATVSHSDQFDPNPGNNTGTATETPEQADLFMSKSVSNPTPNVGDTVTFTVTVNNHGPDAATNVVVNDLLPAGLQFVSATPSQGPYNATTGVWAVGTVVANVPQTLQIQALVLGPAAQTNVAMVGHSDQFDPNPDNNTGTATETPAQADLLMSKSVSNPTPNVGDTITFTVTLTNKGPDTATGVTVLDALPAGLTFLTATPSQGSYSSLTGLWTVGTVATTTMPTLHIQARVDSPNRLTNVATISNADQFDPDTTNNSASAVETPQAADLAITKQVSNPHPNPGDTITFTVTLTNHGPANASGVQVTDLVPAGLNLVMATPSQGTYTTAGGLWNVGSLANGVTATLTLTAQVVNTLPQTNTATITHADQLDPNPGNNSAGATESPLTADLSLAKTVNDAHPNVGGTVTFTVSLTNKGPNAATNVTVSDTLPAGLALESATPSQGTFAGGTWTVGTVNASSAATLAITAMVVSPGAETNTAAISHSDQFDPDSTNNQASATVVPQQADLVVTKTVDNLQPIFGTSIIYTITVTNNGPDAATNVVVADPAPAGLIPIGAVASQGSFNSGSGMWSVGTLADGATAVLQVAVQTAKDGPIVNNAVGHSDQFDPSLANNQATASVTVLLSPDQISKFPFLASTILGVPDPATFPGNQQFVEELYNGLLHRQADPLGLALFSDFLDNGGSRSQVVQSFLTSPEYQSVLASSPGSPGVSTRIRVTGADAGGGPQVNVYDAQTGGLIRSFYAYDPAFHGGVRVAVGDVNGDGVPDVITAPGPGGGPDIRVWDGQTGQLIREFMAYNPAFTGGVNIAAGSINGAGHADIITGADAGGGPHVEVWDGQSGALVQAFMAYDMNFHGGVRVALGNVLGNGVTDIVTAPGSGGGPDVRAFTALGAQLAREFMAYDPQFTGGVYVAVGNVSGNAAADIITSPGAGGGPDVRVFGGAAGALIDEFMAYGSAFLGGVRVAAIDVNGDGRADIVTSQGPGDSPEVQVFDGKSLALLDALFAYDPVFPGGVFVGGGAG
jgi:uncharacterized repeat protein (TIGR01451 family)